MEPTVIVLCGVSGCGKTTVGKTLEKLVPGLEFTDADDYHSEDNKKKMANGEPLTDEDRLGWLITLRKLIIKWLEGKAPNAYYALACSALKAYYRQILNGQFDKDFEINPLRNTTDRIIFVILSGSKDLILQRLKNRKNHFMPSILLDSQIQTLELSEIGPKFLLLDTEKNAESIAHDIISYVKNSQQ